MYYNLVTTVEFLTLDPRLLPPSSSPHSLIQKFYSRLTEPRTQGFHFPQLPTERLYSQERQDTSTSHPAPRYLLLKLRSGTYVAKRWEFSSSTLTQGLFWVQLAVNTGEITLPQFICKAEVPLLRRQAQKI